MTIGVEFDSKIIDVNGVPIRVSIYDTVRAKLSRWTAPGPAFGYALVAQRAFGHPLCVPFDTPAAVQCCAVHIAVHSWPLLVKRAVP